MRTPGRVGSGCKLKACCASRIESLIASRSPPDRPALTPSSPLPLSRYTVLDLTIARKVGDNDTLYGSVTNGDIADLLKEKGFDIDRRKILLPDPLRALGEALVPVKLHRDVTAQLKITVVKQA